MTELRICLAELPWQALSFPSLPIGLLRASCREHGRAVPRTYHGSLRWAEFLLSATDGAVTPQDYTEIAEKGMFAGVGDWVFAGVLHHDAAWGVDAFSRYAEQHEVNAGRAWEMRELADEWVDLAVQEIMGLRPDVVGFTTTFMQNVPSLAVAGRLKQVAPEVRIIFGGGNCDGPMGSALHRNFSFVDFVVRGEGEEVFPRLLDAIEHDGDLSGLSGVCWRDGARSVANPMAQRAIPADRIPIPDFEDWFEAVAGSPVEQSIEPTLVFESARGCWWGEKHHCAFCGLNGSSMRFRSKSPDRFVSELTALVKKHQVLDVIVVDNIIDQTYFSQVLPRIAGLDWDLRIHYEVKSNLKPNEVDALRRARVVHIQPGIESLISPVLKLMGKGVKGTRNIRTLRDCESARLTVSWNWLYGFPGEKADDYHAVIDQFRALVHLQPPSIASRIALERFSPYFERTELGFVRRAPDEVYGHIYSLPPEELADLVFLFECDPAGIGGDDVKRLEYALDAWKTAHNGSTLVRLVDDDGIHIADRRIGWPRRDHHITDPMLVAAYLELEHGRSLPALLARLQGRGMALAPGAASAWLDDLRRDGLVFSENGQHVALATADAPTRVQG